jgi:23S rRNA (cytosine1962-C5)-methyltransferase
LEFGDWLFEVILDVKEERDMAGLPRIILKTGKEKPLLRGHPWVFSGAVREIEGNVLPGDTGEVYSREGKFLGIGHINPRSQIIVRVLSWEKEELGIDFFKKRIREAFLWREKSLGEKADAYRIINGEGDFLPGLIVDRYGEILVLQCLTVGMDRLKRGLADLLAEEFHPKSIYERSDLSTRREEGLSESRSLLYGKDVPDYVEIREGEARFRVDVKRGQKTGFYLDQRENRSALRKHCEGRSVLDCFSYSGAFSIHAGLGGAKEVTLIDSSQEALDLAEEHFSLNHLERIPRRLIRGDAFEVMRDLKPGYDIIIMDPPPFAKKKGHLAAASRGYKDINLQAFRLLKKGGLLFTFTCSHHVSWDLFQKILFSAAVDAGRKVQLIGRMGHPVDHPVDLCHPEGEYLKGLIFRVL